MTKRHLGNRSCISFDSYIKPQLILHPCQHGGVVYLLIPTSNHNLLTIWFLIIWLYIFWFLHQTTTGYSYSRDDTSCISFDSYIKPQPAKDARADHQLYIFWFLHQTTTSCYWLCSCFVLYIFWFLHQTTTVAVVGIRIRCCISFDSYIKPQLKTACKMNTQGCISFDSYIKPQLYRQQRISCLGCISFDSYIKPQLMKHLHWRQTVVYLLIPTSNHNSLHFRLLIRSLYIFWFLHQTTTNRGHDRCRGWLYIFWFLHQTTTPFSPAFRLNSCISFDSYIKPQHRHKNQTPRKVVYLLIPTSNHNCQPFD